MQWSSAQLYHREVETLARRTYNFSQFFGAQWTTNNVPAPDTGHDLSSLILGLAATKPVVYGSHGPLAQLIIITLIYIFYGYKIYLFIIEILILPVRVMTAFINTVFAGALNSVVINLLARDTIGAFVIDF